MSVVLSPGPPARPEHAARAHERYRILQTELPRLRAAAAAWRNGLAGLLAALVGFGLIKGRSEIDKVASPWHIVVGTILLFALLSGAVGALWLLRACNGDPASVPTSSLVTGVAADHCAALAGLRDLRRGIAGTLLCAALLVLAVAFTWYSPGREGPKLRVQIPGALLCGSVEGVNRGRLTLRTDAGSVIVDLGQALTVAPVEACP
ncbi:hypothetical protein [Streptomyces sp. NPDC001978]|uniref:hypothetical protein n=1 Tax=Streptomyces sp. NPDC001978 TaxID=3364627 RepID=UPI0036AE0BB4